MNSDHQTLENTRRMANEAMERASNRVNSLRTGVHDAASRGASAVSERAAAAQRYMGEYASASTRYVTDHPLKSALIAAAIGAAVAGLVLAMRSRRDSDKHF
ncbi:MAG: hypothetical protein JWP65_3827 [Ramlibacter sp.]|jgi:ElaB/YqjD/DUF883 family membrane-anchored ribosome-binding protein|uniref:glycine zipper domain-containing protein n=1 Tax=Ramlibacter sp. TaxID=1917967 RepID=UPI00260FE6F8|nr:hypothetical protein [Ramlibacter sp.]MDB5753406.1 hypothetical protein [Ramlibacter sp.]